MALSINEDLHNTPKPRIDPHIAPSPGYSFASAQNPRSMFNIPPLPLPPPPTYAHAHLSQADLELSQKAYSELLATAKAYRLALGALSSAASCFGSALESCARLKEARSGPLYNPSTSYTTSEPCTAGPIMAASGVHHLISNHQQILSETVYRALEVPLLEELDSWQRSIEEEEVSYQAEARLRAKEIRKSEGEGAKLQRAKRWNVAGLRSHLAGLTGKLDAFTSLHSHHAQTLLRESQDISRKVVDCISSLVRAEVEIFEGLARKGWTGGGLEELLEKGEDPFAMESDQAGHEGNGASTIHSILLPTGLLSSAGQSLGVPRDSDKEPTSLADELSPQGDDGDYDERSVFFDPGMDQAMRPFASPPSPHPAEERTAFIWESERPASEPDDRKSSVDPVQHDENAMPEGSAVEHDEDMRVDGEGLRERRWSVTDDS
ncbi:MAG: hypothetical protein M1830_005391 [Pleopsidium flavum]|nr:MAG: hypothetical protein M1830_005391 [Pleopsidium flavum]